MSPGGVERGVYLTVLHRLFESGSDRPGERWRRDVWVHDADGLRLQHLYRAMRWVAAALLATEKNFRRICRLDTQKCREKG